MNSYHPTIKFKCKKEVNFSFTTRKVDFLDTSVWIDDDGFLQTTLYSKPSRVVQYLLPSGSHPSHITKNIPYSLGYRLKRIESTQELFETNLTKLGEELLTQTQIELYCVQGPISQDLYAFSTQSQLLPHQLTA